MREKSISASLSGFGAAVREPTKQKVLYSLYFTHLPD